MKKKLLILIVVCFIGIVSISIYTNLHKKITIDSDFQFPSELEDEILLSFNSPPKISEMFLEHSKDLMDENKWMEIKKPNTSDQWKKIINKKNHWNVSGIDETKDSEESWYFLKSYSFRKFNVADGFFISIYKGEWGGALYFYPNGNKEKRYKVQDGYISGFYKMNNKHYILEKLPGADPENGKILNLRKRFNKWSAQKTIELGDFPQGYTIENGNTMYLVTYSKLLKLVDNKIEEVIIDDTFWVGLYPQSISVVDNKFIYIGMRGGVAKVNLDNKKVQFFMYIEETS